MKLPLLLTSLADSALHFPNDTAILTDSAAWNFEQFWVRVARFESVLTELALPA